MRWASVVALVLALASTSRAAAQRRYFEIQVLDGSGAPVPCVELETGPPRAPRRGAGCWRPGSRS